MKINTSYVIAGLAVVIIGLWFLSHSGKDSTQAPSANTQTTPKALPKVVYRSVTAQPRETRYRLYGRTEANREVSVKAETAGLVVSTPAREGQYINTGQLLCQQDNDARSARVDQARAQLASAEFDLRSTQTLVDKGYRSETQLSNQRAQVDGARASVKSAEIELDKVNMRAPFSGVFEKQMAEVGDYLAPGQPCGLLLELNPLVVAIDLSEVQLAAIRKGSKAAIKLATGESLTGKVRFIEARANTMTRTFRTEIIVPNGKMALRAGITATVDLRAGIVTAHQVPGHIMTLGKDGQVGVRYLSASASGEADIVRFALADIVAEDDDGVWVTGLPETARVIIQGQDFVSVGTKVRAVLEGTENTQNNSASQ